MNIRMRQWSSLHWRKVERPDSQMQSLDLDWILDPKIICYEGHLGDSLGNLSMDSTLVIYCAVDFPRCDHGVVVM